MLPCCCARSSAEDRAQHGAARRAIFSAVLAAVFAAGCDEAPPPKVPATTASSTPAKAKLAELPPHMVAAVSAGKTSEMISVHFALRAVPAVGKPLPVDIAIVPHRPFTSIRAVFEGPESVGLTADKHFEHLKDVGSEAVLKHSFTLRPSQEGVFLVTGAVETEGEDGQVTRVYSIPIIVHPATTPAKPAGNPSPAPPPG